MSSSKLALALLALCPLASAQQALPLLGVGATAAAGGSQPAYVASASGSSATLTVPSTTAGNRVWIIVSSKTTTPSAVLGSQSFTLDACSVVSSGGDFICAMHVNQATGGQTSVVVTATTFDSVFEYEFTNPNSSTAIDTTAVCTGTSSATCTTSLTPAHSNEAMVVGFWCANNGTAITGAPVAATHVLTTVGNPTGVVVLSASTQTAAVNTVCESSTAKSGVGIAAAFF